MRFASVRSGLRETSHEVAAFAIDADGAVLFSSGDVDRPLFYRSAIKPFQALPGRRHGLALPDEHLALACASHNGYPVHLAIVEEILGNHSLDTSYLQCPADRPGATQAERIQVALGRFEKQRIYHNCSGKHAGWLATCVIAGYDPATYLDPQHTLQQEIHAIIGDLTGIDPSPAGVDGCGAPTLRGTVSGLARAFSTLTTDPELAPIANAMARFKPLTLDNIDGLGRLGANWGGPAKGGAEGLFAMARHGLSIATKSADGSREIAVAAAIEVADRIGAMPRGTAEWLEDVRRPPVLGGGVRRGSLELVDA